MSKPRQHSPSNAEPFVALALLLLVPSVAFLLLIGPVKRAYLSMFLFEINRGAFYASVATLLGYIGVAALLAKKKASLLTSDLKDALSNFKRAQDVKLPKSTLLAPYFVVSGALSLAYLCTLLVGVTQWRWVDITSEDRFATLRSILDSLTQIAPFPLIVAVTFLFLNGTGLARRWRTHHLEKSDKKIANMVLLPEPIVRKNKISPTFVLGARESKSSLKFEPDAPIPSWVEYRAPEIFGGMCVFGMKGAGKSQILLRLVDQILEHNAHDPETKMALCVIDVKGDLTDFITRKAAAVGRESDVTVLGIETKDHWNPIGTLGSTSRFSECRQVGYFLRSAMSVGGSQGGDNNKYWEDNADNLCARTLHLLALAGEDVNFTNIYGFITHLNNSDDKSVEYRQTLYNAAQKTILGERILSEELKETRDYFENEFVKLDSRVRTIVINVASNFLQKFMSSEYRMAFGRKHTDPGHFSGFRNLIAKGGIFVLQIRSNEHGTIANSIATLCKLSYMAAVKTRDKNPHDKVVRKTALVCDEYQGYVTPSGSQTEGDDKYFEQSRSFGAIDIIATQQYASIVAAVGEAMAGRILGNFNTLLIFKHNDPKLTEHTSKLAGTEEVFTESINIQEGSSSTKRALLDAEEFSEGEHNVSRSVNYSKREKNLLDPNLFKSLTQFEAIGIFDGFGERRIIRFYVKPVFCPLRTPHREVMSLIAESYEHGE